VIGDVLTASPLEVLVVVVAKVVDTVDVGHLKKFFSSLKFFCF